MGEALGKNIHQLLLLAGIGANILNSDLKIAHEISAKLIKGVESFLVFQHVFVVRGRTSWVDFLKVFLIVPRC